MLGFLTGGKVDHPMAAVGDTSPQSIDTTADEAVDIAPLTEPPRSDPGLDQELQDAKVGYDG